MINVLPSSSGVTDPSATITGLAIGEVGFLQRARASSPGESRNDLILGVAILFLVASSAVALALATIGAGAAVATNASSRTTCLLRQSQKVDVIRQRIDEPRRQYDL